MTLQFSLTENDFLQHQLYLATKSESVKEKRKRSWLISMLAFLSLSFLFYRNGDKVIMYYFFACFIVCLFFYPLYLRSYYKKHYQNFIANTYKNRFNQIASITLNDTNIETADENCESKINLPGFEKFIETADYIYLRLISGGDIIIPKHKIEDLGILKTELQRLAKKANINFVSELDWKWK